MPIYEFFCPGNNKIYSFFARSIAYSGKVPRCPDDANLAMERLISNFAFIGRAEEEKTPVRAHEEDDPRFRAALETMERQFTAMDMDHPDPRQMGRMLRAMTEISGETMPDQMDEVMRRLEGGESLDKLEEQFSDESDGTEPGSKQHDADSGEDALREIKERIKAVRRRPSRDPLLYDMSEYVDLEPTQTKLPKKKPQRASKK